MYFVDDKYMTVQTKYSQPVVLRLKCRNERLINCSNAGISDECLLSVVCNSKYPITDILSRVFHLLLLTLHALSTLCTIHETKPQ